MGQMTRVAVEEAAIALDNATADLAVSVKQLLQLHKVDPGAITPETAVFQAHFLVDDEEVAVDIDSERLQFADKADLIAYCRAVSERHFLAALDGMARVIEAIRAGAGHREETDADSDASLVVAQSSIASQLGVPAEEIFRG